jgi:hypothetical protein
MITWALAILLLGSLVVNMYQLIAWLTLRDALDEAHHELEGRPPFR